MSTIKGELIRLVDDKPNIIQLAQLYLEMEGFCTHSVVDKINLHIHTIRHRLTIIETCRS